MINLGMTAETFMSDYYERRPLLVRGGYLDRDIGWDDVNHAIYVGEKESDFIRIHKDGFVNPDVYSEYCNDVGTVRRRISRPVVRGLLEKGGVLVFNRIDIFSHPISKLCDVFSKIAGANAVANCYVAFRDKESFGKHWDTHDVFAVQLIGRKRWLVYEPTLPLPTSGQTSLHHKRECPPEPVMDIVLEAGDVLYLPRGWWHTAIPLNEETCHVAVGIHAPTVIDYLRWVLDRMASSSETLRQSIQPRAGGVAKVLAAAEEFNALAFNESRLKAYHEESLRTERAVSLLDLSHGFSEEASGLHGHRLSINSKRLPSDIGTQIVINGAKLDLNDHAVKILRTLASSVVPMAFRDLQEVVDEVTAEALEAHLREFIAYDIVSLHRAAPNSDSFRPM